MEVRVYGIRHHGPGSARRLRRALDAWQPQLILLEAPADAAAALPQMVAEGVSPPVALVMYESKHIERASFYPFATFSPEYQAVKWGVEHDIEVRPIDLPARHALAREGKGTAPPLGDFHEPLPEWPGKSPVDLALTLRRDPLSLLAELAGYADSESWWDATLEREEDDPESTFTALAEAVAALRAAFPMASDAENEQREAYMRNELRKARREAADRIAVVVGAWHVPAFDAATSQKTDRARLRGLARVKVSQAWVPWSFPRLGRASGYGAGVHAPAWYDLLFRHPDDAVSRYMAAAAQLLREEGLGASPAMATEGVALAATLASLRGHRIPGIGELEEAALATLAGGVAERLKLVHQRLTVGERVGTIPPSVTTVPLLEDLYREIRSTRMSKWWDTAGQHYLKATKANPRGGIDLRQANDLRKSHLLHRLRLLGAPWGALQPGGPDTISGFREVWLLEWQPEYVLTLIERSGFGNTLPAAAGGYARQRADSLQSVPELAQLVLDSLRADLPGIIDQLVGILGRRAADTQDVNGLLGSLPTLIETIRYGDTRRTDTTALARLVEELVPRIAAGLPAAAAGIDAEAAETMLYRLAAAHYQLSRMDDENLHALWLTGVGRTAAGKAHPTVAGYCVRLLYDVGRMDQENVARLFSRVLSARGESTAIARWLGGFLHGGGQLLLHFPPLFRLIDDWVRGLEEQAFEEVVAPLRRTFAGFSEYERKNLMEQVLNIPQKDENTPPAPQKQPENDTFAVELAQWW